MQTPVQFHQRVKPCLGIHVTPNIKDFLQNAKTPKKSDWRDYFLITLKRYKFMHSKIQTHSLNYTFTCITVSWVLPYSHTSSHLYSSNQQPDNSRIASTSKKLSLNYKDEQAFHKLDGFYIWDIICDYFYWFVLRFPSSIEHNSLVISSNFGSIVSVWRTIKMFGGQNHILKLYWLNDSLPQSPHNSLLTWFQV